MYLLCPSPQDCLGHLRSACRHVQLRHFRRWSHLWRPRLPQNWRRRRSKTGLILLLHLLPLLPGWTCIPRPTPRNCYHSCCWCCCGCCCCRCCSPCGLETRGCSQSDVRRCCCCFSQSLRPPWPPSRPPPPPPPPWPLLPPPALSPPWRTCCREGWVSPATSDRSCWRRRPGPASCCCCCCRRWRSWTTTPGWWLTSAGEGVSKPEKRICKKFWHLSQVLICFHHHQQQQKIKIEEVQTAKAMNDMK